MHAFLLIGSNTNKLESNLEETSSKLQAKILDFPLIKIEDVRNLNNLIRLSFNEPTLIVCRNIHEAGEEALNAFLKNLEEPQENIFFALTAPTLRKVLPTIVSRCEIVKVKGQDETDQNEEMEQFFKLTTGEKLAFVDKIKDRGKATEFAENAIAFMHKMLHSDGSLHEKELKYSINVKNIELALKTLSRLKANGNVNLQLSNFVINYIQK